MNDDPLGAYPDPGPLPVERSNEPAPEPVRDPVWYGVCGHWTSDWSKLLEGPPPLCPIHRAPGFHAEPTWWADVDKYEADGHPGYRADVEALELK